VQLHVLVRGQLLIQAGILEDDPEPASDIRGVRDRIQTVDPDGPARRREERRQHLDRRGLPGSRNAFESLDAVTVAKDLGRSRADSGAYSFKVHQGFAPRASLSLALGLALMSSRPRPSASRFRFAAGLRTKQNQEAHMETKLDNNKRNPFARKLSFPLGAVSVI
jgi:hypothetical protein